MANVMKEQSVDKIRDSLPKFLSVTKQEVTKQLKILLYLHNLRKLEDDYQPQLRPIVTVPNPVLNEKKMTDMAKSKPAKCIDVIT